MYSVKIVLFVYFFAFKYSSSWAGFLEDNYPATLIEDGKLDGLQLLQKYHYPGESHYVTTEDNYILNVIRIPRPGAKPIFLMHGLQDSSDSWIMLGPEKGLGYYLYDEGYDVWMGNARGNRYSRNHTTIYKKERAFWRFSWHEIGIYDLPAMIDTVLNKTGYKKLTYFGHSQGTTSFFVMCSMRPAYNDKVHIMHALAPVAFMGHIKTPLTRIFKSLLDVYPDDQQEFLPHSDLMLQNCFTTQFTLDTCLHYLWRAMGKDTKQMNLTMLPVIFGHVPAGSSLKQFKHYLQLVDSRRFCQYDYGPIENNKHYGSMQPPEYPITKISTPIGLYYSYNDYLSSEVDVQRLAKILPSVAEDHLYPYKKWNHLTVVWGIDARRLAHKRMLELTKLYESGDIVINQDNNATIPATEAEAEAEAETEENEEVEEGEGAEEVKKI